jgi:5-hydroxyisourate hydrolase-like protein (transthyretin family)
VVGLGGSFEPGKLFTVTAHVLDPAPGQSLTLELPAGMERVEGKERQPVPAIDEDGNTMVLWKARVLNTGRFNLRIHSSTGIIQTKIITITRPGENTAGT